MAFQAAEDLLAGEAFGGASVGVGAGFCVVDEAVVREKCRPSDRVRFDSNVLRPTPWLILVRLID